MIKTLVEAGIEPNEAKAEINFILETVLNKTKEELLLIDEFNSLEIENAIQQRVQTKKPVQYILNTASFMGKNYFVNENVLIPRDDTEILVREAFKTANTIDIKSKKILDIGTGTGIIACSLGILSKENNKNFEILGIDISTSALIVAIENMKRQQLQKTVMFRKSDLFSNIRENEKFDIIVSNPPYIPIKEFDTIQAEVKFEPKLALFTDDDDGLYFYKKIIKDAPKFLNKGGYILFEMMMGQAKAISNILKTAGFSQIEIIKDVSNIERVIKAKTI